MRPQPFTSTGLIEKELLKRGYHTESFRLAGLPYLRCTAPNGWILLTPRRFFTYPFTSAISRNISIDKDKAYAFATRLGITVPQTLAMPGASVQELDAFLEAYAPLVVKPVDGHGSGGVVLDIMTSEELQTATQDALLMSERALVQQQIAGGEVRMTVLRGEVVSAILRQTPRVIGDGASTIQALITAENEQRALLEFDYITYPLLDGRLVSLQLLQSAAVPVAGEVVELNKSTMIRGGASFYNVTDQLDQSYKDAAVRLTAELDTPFLVVDMIMTDHTEPMSGSNHAFIEFNTAPALCIYYVVRDNKPYDIVTQLAGMIDQAATLR
jgi:D-alanine-D-alanine ligase-like ATP-grasp enzyme